MTSSFYQTPEKGQGLTPVPIIALTADALHEQQSRGKAAGMNAYLTKPIDAQQLSDVIDSLRRGGYRVAAQ